jgi:uncharacterized protein YegP (UPF0339 family)
MATIEIYKDKRGEFRWRATFRGRTLADSGEGYKRRATVHGALRRVFGYDYTVYYRVKDMTRPRP